MGASQCKVWYLNCGRQGHAVWLCDIEGAKPQLRVMVDGECVFAGDPATVPEHGEILRQPLEKAALVVSMEKTPKQPVYRVTWDGRDYEDDLALLQSKKSTVDMADVYKVRLKAMEVKMEDAPVKEGSAQVKSTAFFTIIANLYTTRNDKHGKLQSPSSSGQIQVCSGVSSHRFSALLDVHDKIGAYYAASLPDVKMPKKPEKSVKGTSGVSTSDADFIGQRKMAIDKWLSGLCSLPRLVYLPDFVEFFGLPSIRPKYCGGHIVFTQPTSLESPAHQPREKAGGEELDDAASTAAAAATDAGAAGGGGGGGGAKGAPAADGGFQPSDSDDEEYVVVAGDPEKPKEGGVFETVDDFDDFNTSPSKAGAGMEVPEAYSVEGVREVGLTMFGEEEDDEEGAAKPTGAAAAVADIDAEHARTVAAGGQSGDGGGDGDGAAAAPPPVELTPVERLLQAESKLSLYQERLDQAEESGKHGLVDKLYDEIAKLQKKVFVLQEEAEAYEAAHAPTEAELWEEEDDGAVQIVEQPLSAGGVLANTPRRMTSTGGDEWGDFAAGGEDDDEWGDGGDGGDDPFGGGGAADRPGEGGAGAGAAAATAGGPAPGGDDAGGDPFAGNDEWE